MCLPNCRRNFAKLVKINIEWSKNTNILQYLNPNDTTLNIFSYFCNQNNTISMNHKEFLTEVQKVCHADHHQCVTLLSALQKLMVKAAMDQIPVNIKGLGSFTSHKHPEYIQEDPSNGEQTLFPPRISYRMQAENPTSPEAEQSITKELAEYANLPVELTDAFLNAFATVIQKQLNNRDEVEVHGIGSFQVIEAHQSELHRIAFNPDEQMRMQVNAPFNCFEPVIIRKGIVKEEVVAVEPTVDAIEQTVESAEKTFEPASESVTQVTEDDIEPQQVEVNQEIEETEVPANQAEPETTEDIVKQPSGSEKTEQIVEDKEEIIDPIAKQEPEIHPTGEETVVIVSEESKSPKQQESMAETSNTKQEQQVLHDDEKKNKNSNTFLYSALTVTIIACIAFVAYLFMVDRHDNLVEAELAIPEDTLVFAQNEDFTVSPDELEEDTMGTEIAAEEKQETPVPVETNQAQPVEEVKPVVVETKQTQPVAEPKATTPTEQPKPAQVFHRLMGADGKPVTVTLNAGERLTIISLNQYGDKAFWPYIFEVNSDRIQAPNLVQAGMKLYLPDPAYYDIDANSEESLRKAKNRGAQLLR